MKVTPRQIRGFLAAVPDTIQAVLFHGSDLGQISERASVVARQFSDDLDDVFSVTRLQGDQLSSDPAILGDAAESLSMTASRRLVLVKGRGSEMLEASKIALSRNLDASFIVMEATDTNTRHALVKLFETSDKAAAVGCYPDTTADIAEMVRTIMARDSITISKDALTHIVGKLGSDHATSRAEIEKLALLAGPGGSLEFEDVSEALGDSALLAVTDIAIAAAEGQVSNLQTALDRAWSENLNSVMLMRGCQGYFKQLMTARRATQAGHTPQQAVKSLRPPIHFKLQDRIASQLRIWNEAALGDALNRLQDAELALKTGMSNDETYCSQVLLGVCLRSQHAQRQGGGR